VHIRQLDLTIEGNWMVGSLGKVVSPFRRKWACYMWLSTS